MPSGTIQTLAVFADELTAFSRTAEKSIEILPEAVFIPSQESKAARTAAVTSKIPIFFHSMPPYSIIISSEPYDE